MMKFKEKIPEQKPTFETDEEGFVNFGEVSRALLSKQAQYGSYEQKSDFCLRNK